MNFDFYRSTSQRRAYRTCPKKFFLKYGLKYRQKTLRATYVFGTVIQQVLHVALEQRAFGNQTADPQDVFLWLWDTLRNAIPGSIKYPQKYGHKEFRERGVKLIVACFDEVLSTLVFDRPIYGRHPFLLEPDIRYRVGRTEERVIPDYIGWAKLPICQVCAEVVMAPEPMAHFANGGIKECVGQTRLEIVRVVIDWKTADRDKDLLAADLDEQLTSEQLGANSRGIDVDYVCLATFVYQATAPRVQWLWRPARTGAELEEFRQTATMVDQQIRQGVFYRNDQACNEFGGCEMRPICFARLKDRIGVELEQDLRYAPGSADGLFDDL